MDNHNFSSLKLTRPRAGIRLIPGRPLYIMPGHPKKSNDGRPFTCRKFHMIQFETALKSVIFEAVPKCQILEPAHLS
jgi:hypothetical protein